MAKTLTYSDSNVQGVSFFDLALMHQGILNFGKFGTQTRSNEEKLAF